jgi:hypothetical protein
MGHSSRLVDKDSQAINDVLAAHTLVTGDGAENRVERSHPESAMRRNGDPVR